MSIFGDRLREIRTKRKLTMKQLGEKVGLTESAIGMIERGERNPSYDKLVEIAECFEVDLYYLLGQKDISIKQPIDENELIEAKNHFYNKLGFRSDDNFMESNDDQSLISLYKEVKKYPNLTKEDIINNYLGNITQSSSLSEIIRLPLYASISCGVGMFVEDNIIDNITLPESLLNKNKDYFCQYADGDSMIGENINPGDLLVFEKAQTIENGQIGCFCIDDNIATCKKFYKDDASAIITLQPSNNKYSPIIVTIETMNFHVVGKLALVISKRS